MRRNLVIVRAGANSLHSLWLADAEAPRSWDLWVSVYDEMCSPPCVGDVQTFEPGSKLTGLASLLQTSIDRMRDYEYIFIPDDDIEMNSGDINRLFVYMKQFDLVLAQPSLSLQSFISREITLNNRFTLLRLTNWIESMAPCFTFSSLEACASTFTSTHTGWGQEVLWCERLKGSRIGIIDGVQVTHTRPFGGPNYRQVQASGTNALCEMVALLACVKLQQPVLRVSGVVTTAGEELAGESFDPLDDRWLTAPW